MLYTLLNTFKTMEEVCQFLNVPVRTKVQPGDVKFIVDFMKKQLGVDIKKKGMTSGDVHELLRNEEFRTIVGIKEHVWEGTQMDLQHILTTRKVENDERYVCFGYQYPEKQRTKGIRSITQFIGKHENEEETEEEVEHLAGKKRKSAGGTRGKDKAPKCGMTAEEKRRPVSESIREELEEGIEKHSHTEYKGSHTTHASLIYYNAHGVPFRYDPGFDRVTLLLPGNRDDAFTQGDMHRGVEIFCTSMLQLCKVYRCKIVLEPRKVAA